MQLEDYFNFVSPTEIRFRSSGLGIETVLYPYMQRRATPEEIDAIHPALHLDEVYAGILYYLQNREQVELYMANWREWNKRQLVEHMPPPHPGIIKLRAHLQERARELEMARDPAAG